MYKVPPKTPAKPKTKDKLEMLAPITFPNDKGEVSENEDAKPIKSSGNDVATAIIIAETKTEGTRTSAAILRIEDTTTSADFIKTTDKANIPKMDTTILIWPAFRKAFLLHVLWSLGPDSCLHGP